MTESAKIKPELAAGIRDYLPWDMIPRQKMFDRIRTVFESFGFVPLDTPGLERESILTGGDPNFQMQIFQARVRGNEEDLALRFDLTVPLARVIAQYPGKIGRPFKRYQVGKVWRGESPQAGRFREFVQFDADIVGSARPAADAEIIALIYRTMEAMNLSRFLIKVNNRKVLNGLPSFAGFDPEKIVEVLRLIDKLDRFGWDNIAGEMVDVVKIPPKALPAIQRFLDLRAGDPTAVVTELRQLMSDSATALEGINELEQITEHLMALEVPNDRWAIDLSVARGLGYYTGPVFETTLLDLPSIGSVFSGGRFDGLVGRFSETGVPATGASIGVDRLFAALEKLGLVRQEKTIARVCVLNFDPQGETFCEAITTKLRGAGINAELYLGKEVTLKAQLAYATSQEFPICLIIGAQERDRGIVRVKDMVQREQLDVPTDNLIERIQQMLRLLRFREVSASLSTDYGENPFP